MTIRLRATCTITFEYEVAPEDYLSPGTTKEQAIEIETKTFKNDSDTFFELASVSDDVYTFLVEEVK